MSRNKRGLQNQINDLVEIKSQFHAEFRRFSLNRNQLPKFYEFANRLEASHRLKAIPHYIFYTDPIHGGLLPINNEDNYQRAILSAKPLLRLSIHRNDESWEEINSYRKPNKSKNIISQALNSCSTPFSNPQRHVSSPEDFRQVSAIIDVDVVPETCRRVRLLKQSDEKSFGIFIRDGTIVRVTPEGLEKVPGIFISRIIPGGVADITGLLAVNDEVLEVNGVSVVGKSVDQVVDMMVANSFNLIITVKPNNTRNTVKPLFKESVGKPSLASNKLRS